MVTGSGGVTVVFHPERDGDALDVCPWRGQNCLLLLHVNKQRRQCGVFLKHTFKLSQMRFHFFVLISIEMS